MKLWPLILIPLLANAADPDLNLAHAKQGVPVPSYFFGPSVVISKPSVVIVPPYARVIWQAESNAVGYNVYYGTESQRYPFIFPARSNLQVTVTNLMRGRAYYFALTWYDTDGFESTFSDEVEFVIPTVIDLRLNPPGKALQSSTDLVNWYPRDATLASNVWRVVNPEAQEFYRAKLQ